MLDKGQLKRARYALIVGPQTEHVILAACADRLEQCLHGDAQRCSVTGGTTRGSRGVALGEQCSYD